MDPAGNATVVWADYVEQRIVARRYNETAGWQPEVVLDGGTASYRVSPQQLDTETGGSITLDSVSVDSDGNAFASWQQDDKVFVSRYD